MGEHGEHEMMGHAAAAGMFEHLLGMLLVLAVLGAAYWAAQRRGLLPKWAPRLAVPRPATQPRALAQTEVTDAEQLLDLRLARGEIDVADYHERRSALRSSSL